MSYIRMGVPRNTSNGDYGRFHFIPNMSSSGGHLMHQNTQFSSDGNRMVQHVHYPNCPNNRQTSNKFSDGMKEYTVEYGEDAVRAALGGNMPDFQAQFQQQYGGGDATNSTVGGAEQPASLNDGKPKVAMTPEMLTSEEKGNQGSNNQANSNVVDTNTDTEQCQPDQSGSGATSLQTGISPSSETPTEQMNSSARMSSKQENLANAFESVRRARSTGQVKYGRHIRPSYWKPETPNPCRRRTVGGSGVGGVDDVSNGAIGNGYPNGNQEPMNAAYPNGNQGLMNNAYPNYAYPEMNGNPTNFQEMAMPTNGAFAPPPMIPVNVPQQHTDAYQRTRSLPPKQAVRPTYSLCGKCKKCKNLRSETPESSVLTFPKYSDRGFQRQSQMLTSSNLSQSAKNFRAIRFSSHHM